MNWLSDILEVLVTAALEYWRQARAWRRSASPVGTAAEDGETRRSDHPIETVPDDEHTDQPDSVTDATHPRGGWSGLSVEVQALIIASIFVFGGFALLLLIILLLWEV